MAQLVPAVSASSLQHTALSARVDTNEGRKVFVLDWGKCAEASFRSSLKGHC